MQNWRSTVSLLGINMFYIKVTFSRWFLELLLFYLKPPIELDCRLVGFLWGKAKLAVLQNGKARFLSKKNQPNSGILSLLSNEIHRYVTIKAFWLVRLLHLWTFWSPLFFFLGILFFPWILDSNQRNCSFVCVCVCVCPMQKKCFRS